MTTRLLVCLALACGLAAACSGKSAGSTPAADAGTADASLANDATSTTDAGPPADAATATDTSGAIDAGAVDAATAPSADVASGDVASAVDAAVADAGGVKVLSQPQLTGLSWSAGECQGVCGGKVVFEGAKMALTQLDDKGQEVELFLGMWTTGGAAKMDAALATLTGKVLQGSYGCPGCTDAPVFKLTLAHDGTSTVVTFDGVDVPADLKPLTELLQPGMASLQACKTDELVVVTKPCPAGLP